MSRHRRQRHRRSRRAAELARMVELLRTKVLATLEQYRKTNPLPPAGIDASDALFSIFGFRRVKAEG